MSTNFNLDFAGDYHLPYINLISHTGEGVDSGHHGENISAMLIELNIFESVFSGSVTGSAVIVDTKNLIANLPIQGTERLSFLLSTKLIDQGNDTIIDCTEKSGKSMHVYAIMC